MTHIVNLLEYAEDCDMKVLDLRVASPIFFLGGLLAFCFRFIQQPHSSGPLDDCLNFGLTIMTLKYLSRAQS